MVTIRDIKCNEKNTINDIVSIHLETFKGFFLTFMGRGFLKQMYSSYCTYENAGLIAAFDENKLVGFLAYASDFSGLYTYMIKKRLFLFAWYSILAFFRKPAVFLHLIRAFLKPSEVKKNENYIELSSIGVSPDVKSKGIGSQLISYLKEKVDFSKFAYITLETDAIDNDGVNQFYIKNGFKLERTYSTYEGRLMNEYRYKK